MNTLSGMDTFRSQVSCGVNVGARVAGSRDCVSMVGSWRKDSSRSTRTIGIKRLISRNLVHHSYEASSETSALGTMSTSGGKRSSAYNTENSFRLHEARASSRTEDAPKGHLPAVMVNSLTGKMGLAVAKATVAAGLPLVPYSMVGEPEKDDRIADVDGLHVQLRYKTKREELLDDVLSKFSDVIVVDFTVPQSVNDNAEFYCKRGVPFVMGTTGGDRAKLMNDVLKAGNYAVIAPQMGKQVVAFQAAMQIMADQFPGAFSGYTLKVTESHQSSKLDTSGTAKAIVGSFLKLGLEFDLEEIEMVRDREQQLQRMKVPAEHLLGHAYHTYQVVSPDNTVAFEFQHNVCGRSIYAEGTVDAVLFLAKKIEQKAEKKVYDMIDVLREGNMR